MFWFVQVVFNESKKSESTRLVWFPVWIIWLTGASHVTLWIVNASKMTHLHTIVGYYTDKIKDSIILWHLSHQMTRRLWTLSHLTQRQWVMWLYKGAAESKYSACMHQITQQKHTGVLPHEKMKDSLQWVIWHGIYFLCIEIGNAATLRSSKILL